MSSIGKAKLKCASCHEELAETVRRGNCVRPFAELIAQAFAAVDKGVLCRIKRPCERGS
jgi:hypothetical protein